MVQPGPEVDWLGNRPSMCDKWPSPWLSFCMSFSYQVASWTFCVRRAISNGTMVPAHIHLLSMVGSISYAHQLVLFGVGFSNWSSRFTSSRSAARLFHAGPMQPFSGLRVEVFAADTESCHSGVTVVCSGGRSDRPYIMVSPLLLAHAFWQPGTFVLGICVLCISFLHSSSEDCLTVGPAYRGSLHFMQVCFLVCITAAQPLEGRTGHLYSVHRVLASQDRS